MISNSIICLKKLTFDHKNITKYWTFVRPNLDLYIFLYILYISDGLMVWPNPYVTRPKCDTKPHVLEYIKVTKQKIMHIIYMYRMT
jgi:hypothetical protein